MISYILRTNYAKPREFQETIKSILRQKGDKEIIVVGVLPEEGNLIIYNIFSKMEDFICSARQNNSFIATYRAGTTIFRFFETNEWASQGYTSKMRDKGIQEAKGDYLVCLDDDILFLPDFQENIGTDDVQIPVCDNIRGGRFWDWAVKDHPELGHRKINYDVPYSEHNYLSGQCFILKRDTAILHETDLKFHESDDIDYGKKLQKAGLVFTMNTKAKTIHNDPRYIATDNGLGVLKFE
jgi:GT2 family glycosyltransferase